MNSRFVMRDSGREGAFQRACRGACTSLAAAALLWAVAACGSLRPADPPPAAPGIVKVVDRNGDVSAATENRVLEGVKAEGRPDLAARQLSVLASTGDSNLYRGNATRLLVDGPQTLGAMKAAIAAAKTRVYIEMYIFEDEGVAAQVGELLKRKAAEGVRVALMYDSVGSLKSDQEFFSSLQEAGVAVCAFNPVNPLTRPGYWSINHRDHRKILVVDSESAFTGGINISRVYASGSASFTRKAKARAEQGDEAQKKKALLEDGWRDTQIELRGPAVGALAALFRANWFDQGCKGRLGVETKASNPLPGARVVRVIGSDPRDPRNEIYESMLAALNASQRSVHITMAYFAPGREMLDALSNAARRGVDVQLVLPGASDFSLILHAGRSYYTELLKAGVHIFEMKDAMMHAKTAVIDGVFSTVGSSNLDWRSFVNNNEVNVIVLGDDFGTELEALFQRDLKASTEIKLDSWRKRGAKARFMESFARTAERLL